MKRKVELVVKSVDVIALDTFEMTLVNKYVAKTAIPGQFLHLLVDGHTLRRPISIANVDRNNNEITILFKIVGDGTKQLAAYKPGMSIDALGPSGNGFSYEGKLNSVLLVGGGIGIPPLYNLGKTLKKKGIKVTAVLGFQSKEHVFYEANFRELGKTYVVTNDGTYGYRGFVTSVMDQIEDFDTYYSCGPIPMLKAVTKQLQDHSGYISLEERMGCGVGACFACVIPTDSHGGYKKICKDGPVFAADEVVL
ncbi:dihydroorotate dehydrogenase electron transfer subunit [Virgibacillus salinus]|uniref:Dihydroorotate dehydrogenase B (NAD(+)), electron transfer subunit n=1 Tax=Virgibacillus salinus TaxID=553311 RepID=A0A1H1CF52_9BACI|nr:dihydroorotate dehydrogenase electron transfer subunit [Virgibacillus salinus]SDQ62326.1 dihydroorotate oxidase B, electron transfer subunit [Virgibacillus salinus]